MIIDKVKPFFTEEHKARLQANSLESKQVISSLSNATSDEEREYCTARLQSLFEEENNIMWEVEESYIDSLNNDYELLFDDVREIVEGITKEDFENYADPRYLASIRLEELHEGYTDKTKVLYEHTAGALARYYLVRCRVQYNALSKWEAPQSVLDKFDQFLSDRALEIYPDTIALKKFWLDLHGEPLHGKRQYKTRSRAGYVSSVPDTLALFSSREAKFALTGYKGKKNQLGYLVNGLASFENVSIDNNGKIVVSEDKLDLNPPDEESLDLLPAILAIMNKDYEDTKEFKPYYSIRLQDLANKIYGTATATKDSRSALFNKIKLLDGKIGVFTDYDTGYKSLWAVVRFHGYDEATETVHISCPFLTMLMKQEKDRNTIKKKLSDGSFKENTKPYLSTIGSMSLKSERNKPAVRIVEQIIVLVQENKSGVPNISAQELLDRMPAYKEKILSLPKKSQNIYLKRAFTKALEILNDTKTDKSGLHHTYIDLKVPALSPENIPNIDSLRSIVYKFPNKGRKSSKDAEPNPKEL